MHAVRAAVVDDIADHERLRAACTPVVQIGAAFQPQMRAIDGEIDQCAAARQIGTNHVGDVDRRGFFADEMRGGDRQAVAVGEIQVA